MSFKSDIGGLVVASLNDIRTMYVRLFIEELLERRESNLPKYRVRRVADDTPVTSYAEFVAAITEANFKLRVSLNTPTGFSGMVKPVRMRISGLKVELLRASQSDSMFAAKYGSEADSIELVIGYVGDGDPTHPIQVVDVHLVQAA